MEDIQKLLAASLGKANLSTNPDMLGHADRIWKMLDHLAESDPAAYATFIKEQAEAAGPLKPTAQQDPVIIIHCSRETSYPGNRMIVSVFKSQPGSQVPTATTGNNVAVTATTCLWKDVHIPFAARGDVMTTTRENINWEIIELECHEDVLGLAAKGTPPALRAVLTEAALRHVEQAQGCKLNRSTATLQVAKSAMTEAEAKAAQASKMTAAAKAAAKGTSVEGVPTSLLAQLSHIAAAPQQQPPGTNKADWSKPSPAAKKPLIQEL